MDTRLTQIKDRIRGFIMDAGRLHTLDDDEQIFRAGYFSSLFAAQLVIFVEREFAITVETEDLDIRNFASVNAVSRLVAGKVVAGEVVGKSGEATDAGEPAVEHA